MTSRIALGLSLSDCLLAPLSAVAADIRGVLRAIDLKKNELHVEGAAIIVARR